MAGAHWFVSTVTSALRALGLGPEAVSVRLIATGMTPVSRDVTTYGPGDARALDPAIITRREPMPGSTGFEPNLLPLVELAHPALPWLLTPAAGRVPWLVLIVVKDQPGVTLQAVGSGRPILTIDHPANPADELPDLDDAWAWVHAYGTSADGANPTGEQFSSSRGTTRARFLCPRRLQPQTRYLAAVVPAYAAGVRASLGEPVDVADTSLAWTSSTNVPLRIPVFDSWSFTTGVGGDFISLARLLTARRLDTGRALRDVDGSDPGWGVAAAADRTLHIRGLLHPDAHPPAVEPEALALGAEIATLVNAASLPIPDHVPLLGAPAYGSFATGNEGISGSPAWQQEIASDVSLRIAAGLGAEIVRHNQDELVTEAMRQLGDAEDANRLLRFASLSGAITGRLFARHIDGEPDAGAALQILAPAYRRLTLRSGEPTTVARSLERSQVPSTTIAPAFRRIMRSGGPVARRITRVRGIGGVLIDRTNRARGVSGRIDAAPPRGALHGLAAFDAISREEHIEARFASATPTAVAASAVTWRLRSPVTPSLSLPAHTTARVSHVDAADLGSLPALPSVMVDAGTIDAFEVAARRHQQYLLDHLAAVPPPSSRPPWAVDLADLVAEFRDAAHPDRAIVPGLDLQIVGATVTQDLSPIRVTPVFERPLLDDLKALDLDAVMPGLADIQANTVAVLVPDHAAVRALIVGANHELSSELAWRRYPGPRNQLLLRTFWGRVVRGGDGRFARDPDVPPIAEWPDSGPADPAVGLAVIIRGELLARYPNTVVYLVEAQWQGAFRLLRTSSTESPSVQTALGPDSMLYAFSRTASEARGTDSPAGAAGWYVVIAEAPHAPRFGLAATKSATTSTRWSDVAWTELETDDVHGNHLQLDGPLITRAMTDPPNVSWGLDAGQQAAITLRRPTRIAIHASKLLLQP